MTAPLVRSARNFVPYAALIVFLTAASLAVRALAKDHRLLEEVDFQVFVLGGMLFVGYYINRIAPKTAIPSFVWAIFAGMALQPLLSVITGDISVLKIVMEVFGAIVLFAGGLDIPFKKFQKWFFPIASLSLIGLVGSAIGFAALIVLLLKSFSVFDPSLLPSIVILSAALASTDPTAIIPTLSALRFKRPFLKQIAISESALTDVSGSVITRFLLIALIGVAGAESGVLGFFMPLFRKSSYDALALQIISGVLVGYVGYRFIRTFYYGKGAEKRVQEDPALLLSVPIFTFALGNVLGGAGFLAAFVAGLLSDVDGGIRKVSHFYTSFLDHLVKPFIFIVLGALVPLETLIRLAPTGIAAAGLFMFVVRPLVVFISLLPWLWNGTMTFKDLLFLSFIRETGIIAAILLIIASTNSLIKSDFLIAIGMWVILLTLVIEPPLTPYLARAIGVADKN